MKQLVLAMMAAAMLVSCSNNNIPRELRGCWGTAECNPIIAAYENVAIYQNDVWQYQNVSRKGDSISLTIVNGNRTVNLAFGGEPLTYNILPYESHPDTTVDVIPFGLANLTIDGKFVGKVVRDNTYFGTGTFQEPKIAVPDGNIGEAVIRLYIHNSMRGPHTFSNLGEFFSKECHLVFDNRLEQSIRKMKLVETDARGRMFEITIPVDGMADFHFNMKHNQMDGIGVSLGGTIFFYNINYFVAEGDTALVVINNQEKYGWNGNTLAGFNPTFNKSVDFILDTAKTEDEFWTLAEAFADSVKNKRKYLYSQRYRLLNLQMQNAVNYQIGEAAVQFAGKKFSDGETVTDDFKRRLLDLCPVADTGILRTLQSLYYAPRYVNAFVPWKQSNDDLPDWGWHQRAKELGYSQTAADLILLREAMQNIKPANMSLAEPEASSDKHIRQLIDAIETPAYRNYAESRYKNDYAVRRNLVSRAKHERNLTEEDFAEFERLSDEQSSDVLREIQTGNINPDVPKPRVGFMHSSYKDVPHTAYLLDSTDTVVDSLYSKTGYIIFGSLKPGQYRVINDVRCDTLRFQVPDDKEYWSFTHL